MQTTQVDVEHSAIMESPLTEERRLAWIALTFVVHGYADRSDVYVLWSLYYILAALCDVN